MSATDGGWPDAVIRAVQQLPADLQWRAQVGIVQALRPTVCRGCGSSKFKVAAPKSVECIACGTLTGADTEAFPNKSYIDLGYERRRVRLVVRPLDRSQPRTLTTTRWRSELVAGLWGNPREIQESVRASFAQLLALEPTLDPDDFSTRLARLTALTNVRHGPAIVYVTAGGWSRATWTWQLEVKVEEALLRALGCCLGDRLIWYRPDGEVVFEKDREGARWLDAFAARERYVRHTDRGILPVHLTPTRPAWQVRRWENSRTLARAIFPGLVNALRHSLPERTLAQVRTVAAAAMRQRRADPAGALGELSSEVAGAVEIARQERRRVREFRLALLGDKQEMLFATYSLRLKARRKRLRARRRYLATEGYRVERMYDYLLDPATDPQR